MRLLLTADLHIHNWGLHSSYDEVGVPHRLRLFRVLGLDLLDVADKHRVDRIETAGDTLQTHSPKPMVANTVKALYHSWGQVIPVDAIPGNHDVDQKSGRFDPVHSGLGALLDGLPGVTYHATPALVEWDTGHSITRIMYHPWFNAMVDYDALPAADVFIGHGLVSGAVDPFQHRFTSGYDAARLAAKYPLSVIGDIHQRQVIQPVIGGGRVLIPGQPIQINYSSGQDCGVWVYDTETRELEFIDSRTFAHADQYHRFLTVDDEPPADAPATHHYRRRLARAASTATAPSPTTPLPVVNLLDALLEQWRALHPEQVEMGADLIRDAYTQAPAVATAPASVPTQLRLGQVDIHDFYSIGAFAIDFRQLEGDVLVVGKNGSGKSSLVDAVYWCLTGKTTKDTPVGDISNAATRRPATVSAELLAPDGTSYRVVRSRDPARLLELYRGDANITKASAQESQDWIYQLLGLAGPRDLLALMYYSSVSPVTFTDFTAAEQFEFLGRLTDAERLDAMRTHLRTASSEANVEYRVLESTLQQAIQACDNKRAELAQTQNEVAPSLAEHDAAVLAELRQSWPQLESVAEARAWLDAQAATVRGQLDSTLAAQVTAARTTANALTDGYRRVSRDLAVRHDSITSIRRQLVTLQTAANCTSCGQPLPDTARQEARENLMEQLRTDGDMVRLLTPQAGPAKDAMDRATADLTNKERALSEQSSLQSQLSVLSAAQQLVQSTPRTDSTAVMQVLTDQYDRLVVEVGLARAACAAQQPRRDTLQLICDKLMQKNSPAVAKIVYGVFEALVARVNELVANPAILVVEAVPGKSLGLAASFNGGRKVKVAGMSAGQRRLFDIMVMLASASLYEQRYGLTGGVLGAAFYDEIITYLDPEYLDVVVGVMANLGVRTRIMITHDEALASYYDRMLRVELVNELSVYTPVNIEVAAP